MLFVFLMNADMKSYMNTQNMTKKPETSRNDEQQIRDIIERWVKAVHERNYDGILASHSANILMFDVPLPFESKGIEAYRKTWDLFFSCQRERIVFDILRMDVVAGNDVAFVAAVMNCDETLKDGNRVEFKFRLTVGLRKVEGKWIVLHEHHSVPAA
jgi:ketosteroid isomerase-like protein